MIPKTIYLYWDQVEIPNEVKTNFYNFKKINKTFDVKLINSCDIETILKNKFPDLYELFIKITIPTCKSDIARCIILYEEGGIYVDCNTIPIDSMENYYNDNKYYDFIISYNYDNTDFSTKILFSKKGCIFLEKVINTIYNNLYNLFLSEKKNDNLVEYNILKLTGTFPFMECLEYDYVSPRNLEKESYLNNLKLYKIGFFSDKRPEVKHYGCNMDHHHGKNFHLHWSNLQKKQKLFM